MLLLLTPPPLQKEAATYVLTDATGDEYTLRCLATGTHVVNYNSKRPSIRKITRCGSQWAPPPDGAPRAPPPDGAPKAPPPDGAPRREVERLERAA